MAENTAPTQTESAQTAPTASHKPAPGFGPHSKPARFVRWQRLIIQIIFLVLAPQTFSLAFAGVKQLFAALGKLEAFDANSFVIMLVVLLAFTVVFGRFFCGYLCAFGTIGDILYKVVDFPLKKLHIKRPRIPLKVENVLRYLKYVVLVFFIVTSLVGASSVVSVYSPWTAFGRILALNFLDLNVIGLALLVIIVLGMIFKERFFCEFLCPMGAVFSLLPVLPWSNHRRNMDACDSCGVCQHSCPVQIYPAGEGAQMGECISCGRCVSACHKHCIGQCSSAQLAARLDAAVTGEAQPASAIKQARTPLVIVLAVVLLVIFWLLQAVNFIPTLG